MRFDHRPAIRCGDICESGRFQDAADFGEMGFLVSAIAYVLDDVVVNDKVELRIGKRKAHVVDLVKLETLAYLTLVMNIGRDHFAVRPNQCRKMRRHGAGAGADLEHADALQRNPPRHDGSDFFCFA